MEWPEDVKAEPICGAARQVKRQARYTRMYRAWIRSLGHDPAEIPQWILDLEAEDERRREADREK